jgi:hypothetical protein
VYLNFPKLACSRERKVADKDLYECQQACVEGDVDIKTGIVPAEIDLAVPDNKPPAPESRVDDFCIEHKAAKRHALHVERPAHVPHEPAGIEFVGYEPAAGPPLTPMAHCFDDGPEFFVSVM